MELGAFSISLAVKNITTSKHTTTSDDSGPSHCFFKDPDGNVIMFDQHF